MTVFTQQNGQLFCEQVALADVQQQYGSPTYVYSRKAITEAFEAYKAGLGNHPGLICYAVKANSNIAVLQVLAELGAGFDIVSQGELERVLAAGGDASKVVFSGVAKRPQEMRRALEVGIHCFNVESRAELEVLAAVAAEEGKVAPVSLRVNPDVDAKTHPYISTGLKENKFGVDIDEAIEHYKWAAAQASLKVVGVDCHIGSQLTEAQPFFDAQARVLNLVDTLAENGIELEHVDMGGGIGVRYENDDTPPNITESVQQMIANLGERKLGLLLEPGRSIVANAGALLTEVIYLKSTEAHNFAIVDAAMNDMIRPALYQAWMEILPVQAAKVAAKEYDVVGPVCETGDFLGKKRTLAIEQGSVLAMLSAGAYGFVMASNYNTRGRAAEVMVDGAQVHLIRERETVESLFAGEHRLG
ncbi:diaminopimelate decarboxylase [Salinibius halmophilus]|uniref:diaminopimelate decarboxylase n=1 Tax=Salinibius halmophilus TaxID=1853216 RepID=UPI000E66B7BA|nr:diaminopimelate decarboxylase [Salinibius halmophilus]